MIKYARTHFYESVLGIIDTLQITDPKSYWELIKKLKKSSGSMDMIAPLIVDDKIYCEDYTNILNDFFTSVSNIDEAEKILPPFPYRTP